jgi:nucleoside 2-deoxyribosyltransferase
MKNCFVVMPFLPQLRYTYLYLKDHIEHRFPGIVTCARGDDQVMTVSLLDKIAAYIKQADVVIADITGRSPNVLYEIGMAHALEKPVILVTGDDVKDAPTDIRGFDYIRYNEGDKEFFDKLDNALTKVLGNQFEELYLRLSVMFEEFKASRNLNLVQISSDKFAAIAADYVKSSGMPKLADNKMIANAFLGNMVPQPVDIKLYKMIGDWIDEKYGV